MKITSTYSFKRVLTSLTFLLLCVSFIEGQEVENKFEGRLFFESVYELNSIDDLEISLTPELRFDEVFAFSKVNLETGVDYKLASFLSLSSAYRLFLDLDDNELYHYFSFSTTVKKKFNRLGTAFRIRYSNNSDDFDSQMGVGYIRFKASIKYNIYNCRITPQIASEVFQPLASKKVYKYRHTAGLSYKVSRRSQISLGYKLDYYMTKLKNRHILLLGYKYEF